MVGSMMGGNGYMTSNRSKYTVPRYAAKYLEMIKDPELLSQRETIAIIDMRIQELLDRIDHDKSDKRWLAVMKAWAEYKGARGTIKETEKYIALDNLMEAAEHDYESWRQIFSAFDVQRKVKESEMKRLKEMNMMLNVEEAMKLSAGLLNAVLEVVDDPRALQSIRTKFIRLIGDAGVGFAFRDRTHEDLLQSGEVDSETLLDSRG
jgi:hypothetical protein